MKATLWGTRGSLASPGPETVRYGGNTSCVEVRAADGTLVVLDAGTGIQRLGGTIGPEVRRVDLLLTHLHMDHIQGLGFFDPLSVPDLEVHIWGPGSTTLDLRARLSRYLSPPLFPVRLRDLPCALTLHDIELGAPFEIQGLKVTAELVCHPPPTVGYRLAENGTSLAYLPDHEPALGARDFPRDAQWTSGRALAEGVDLLIHDAQYTAEEYPEHIGWGHSAVPDALAFAEAASVKQLVMFHHDPRHSDAALDEIVNEARASRHNGVEVVAGTEGLTVEL